MNYYLLTTKIDTKGEGADGFNLAIEIIIIDEDQFNTLTNQSYRNVQLGLDEYLGITDVEDYLNNTEIQLITQEQKNVLIRLGLGSMGNNIFENVMESINDEIEESIEEGE